MFRHLLPIALLSTAFVIQVPPSAPIPEWAREPWKKFAQTNSLRVSTHVKTNILMGKFDGDTTTDVAILVEHTVTKKVGIVFLHHGTTKPMRIGAGIDFGNGGDNFDWMDTWKVEAPTKTRRSNAIFIEKESSASALIYFANGKYRWKQQGD